MTEPHDDLDNWLHTQIDPMQPPPGTFQQIRKRARRRKRRQALLSAASAGAAAAVIVLAVVALPKVVPSVLNLHHSNPAGHSAAAPPPSSPRISDSAGTPFTARSTPVSKTPSVPPAFQASSVTFANLNTGWVLGQAAVGVPGYCRSGYCTSMARTDNAGKSWYGLHAPLTGAPDGPAGVGQVRFLDTENGWAFGPELFATHNGGATWTQVSVPNGMRVTSLETVGSTAFAVFAQCTGTGQDFAAGCTRFFLYSSPAAGNDWTPVPGLAGGFGLSSGTASSATIVLTHGEGYLYTPDGTLVSGPTTAGATWQAASPTSLPCLPGQAEADGQPAGGQFTASAPSDLALACPPSQTSGTHSDSHPETIYTSVNGGQSWQEQGSLPFPVTVTSLAANTGGILAVGTSQGIEVSSDNGANWRQTQTGPSGGFDYVGLTSPSQGVAVPADTSVHQLWFTYASGQSWVPSSISSG
ncbi:MAG TPA: hypothetical protein VGI74_14600 [Streptosporangiaceae bacterium]